ncbi:MAG: hypothetical protein QOJ38_569 [Solirubrobacterales bacterium]|nr:hypothetical protein [Solirubrobacterales bacterium]
MPAGGDIRASVRGGRIGLFATALAVALGCCLATGTVGLAASAAPDAGALRGQINGARQQAQGLAAEVQASQDRIALAAARAQAAARRESQLTALLATGRQRSAALGARADTAQAKLRAAKSQLRHAVALLARRLVAIYKGGSPDMLNVILDSHGFDDMATRSEYLRLIESSDSALARRVRSLRDGVALQLAALRRLRAQTDAFNAQLAAARDQIAAARAAAAAEAAALARARASAAASLDALRGRIGDWERQLVRAQRLSQVQAKQQVSHWLGNWAIPEAVVMCESGGNFHAVNGSSGAGGAYQIIPSTWSAYGGKGRPQDASPKEQGRIAAAIWHDSGPGAWVCAS